MSLNSFYFVVYFSGLYIILYALQRFRKRGGVDCKIGCIQLIILLLFSYFLIYKSSWKFCVCVLAYTCFVYVVGRFVNKNKVALSAGIIVSILMLGYFKYTNFFISEFGRIFGADTVILNIILPLGISFYTFSGLAYLIDIYRETFQLRKTS